MNSPGLLSMKDTAKIEFCRAHPADTELALLEAQQKRRSQEFFLTRSYDAAGNEMLVPASERGAYQAIPDMGTVPLSVWIYPLVTAYFKQHFRVPDSFYAVKTQEVYMWYGPGIGLNLHSDDGGGPASYHRMVTAMIYLNGTFFGGEIAFPQHGIKHKPVAGDVLIFPGNSAFLHEVAPILSGERYGLMQSWKFV